MEVLSAAVRSLSFCPFGEGYMLAGSDDGSVRLHAATNERPLITWPGTVDGQPIVKLVWSTSRPCVFVVLDTASRIHLWDLGSGRPEDQGTIFTLPMWCIMQVGVANSIRNTITKSADMLSQIATYCDVHNFL